MRNYEMLVIFNPEITDEDLPGVIDKVNQQIISKGGNIVNTDNWGKRKLAYPIKRFREGKYILTNLAINPEIIPELEANLRISEDVIRHMLVRLGD